MHVCFQRLACIGVLLGSLTACGMAAPDRDRASGVGPSQSEVAQQHAPDELLVKFKPNVSRDRIEAINQRFGASVKRVLDQGRLYHLSFSQSVNVRELVNAYEQLPEVEYAEPNYTVKTQ